MESEKREFDENEAAKQSIEKYREKFAEQLTESALQRKAQVYPKIVFLGTSSAGSSHTRNGSGILVHIK